ncbi:hypothetical protein OK016_08985 [Vibrio chagasii]|nr:hypothetical protein [Vibrio chagasii]
MLSLTAHAAKFNEGEHYEVLDLKHLKETVVTEFFSFYCPPVMASKTNHP